MADSNQSRENRDNRGRDRDNEGGLEDRVIDIARVAKVVKGGRRFSFSALVAVGDKTGVGFGVGKAGEVPDAIRKGSEQAKKGLVKIPTVDGTIPFEVEGVFGASRVVMIPAQKGKGIIAGGAVRTIVELGGVEDIVCKIHGSRSDHNVVRAVFDGIRQLVSIEDYAANLGRTPAEVQQIRHEQSDAAKKTGEAAKPKTGE